MIEIDGVVNKTASKREPHGGPERGLDAMTGTKSRNDKYIVVSNVVSNHIIVVNDNTHALSNNVRS